MKILALDCSTEACSVALLTEQGVTIEQYELAAREHTQRLLPMVDSALAATQTSLNQLDAIAFGRGPGSFTGLRICLGAVQGLAFGADIPVVPVSTLAALAQTAINAATVESSARLVSMLDARMDEIYWGVYRIEGGLAVPDGPEQLSAPELLEIPRLGQGSVAIGSGWRYAERIPCRAQFARVQAKLMPRASAIAMLAQPELQQGRLHRADQAQPVYLRDQVAWQKQPPQP